MICVFVFVNGLLILNECLFEVSYIYIYIYILGLYLCPSNSKSWFHPYPVPCQPSKLCPNEVTLQVYSLFVLKRVRKFSWPCLSSNAMSMGIVSSRLSGYPVASCKA